MLPFIVVISSLVKDIYKFILSNHEIQDPVSIFKVGASTYLREVAIIGK